MSGRERGALYRVASGGFYAVRWFARHEDAVAEFSTLAAKSAFGTVEVRALPMEIGEHILGRGHLGKPSHAQISSVIDDLNTLEELTPDGARRLFEQAMSESR